MCGNHPVRLGKNLDPTRTTVIRQQFSSKMSKRYSIIKDFVSRSVIDNDCFNLIEEAISMQAVEDDSLYRLDPIQPLYNIQEGTPTEQTSAFMDWLEGVERDVLLQDRIGPGGTSSYWFSPYIIVTTKKAISWARANLIRAYRKAGDLENAGSVDVKQSSIDVRIYDPDIEERIQEGLYRILNGLEGINDASNQAIRRSILDGLRSGWNPVKIASQINTHLSEIGSYRAQLLARTEIIRAHHITSIEEYRQAGVQGVKVLAEFTTARDSRVCPLCADLDYNKTGKLWGLDEIESIIPVHPNCRCAALPAVEKEE